MVINVCSWLEYIDNDEGGGGLKIEQEFQSGSSIWMDRAACTQQLMLQLYSMHQL